MRQNELKIVEIIAAKRKKKTKQKHRNNNFHFRHKILLAKECEKK